MKKFSKIILLSLLIIPLQLQAQNGFTEFKRSGQDYLNEGQYREAVKLLSIYISANPKSPDGYQLRGLAYERMSKFNLSVMDLSQAESMNPADGEIGADLQRVVKKWYDQLSGIHINALPDLVENTDKEFIRFGLIEKLIQTGRYEDSYNLLRLSPMNYTDTNRYKGLIEIVKGLRDSAFNSDVNHLTELLKADPEDKETVIQLAAIYNSHNYLESAIEVLWEYLQTVPDNQDPGLRFLYSQYCARNYEWEKAITQLDILLTNDPDNTEYQLLRGEIGARTGTELRLSEKYLINVLKKHPHEVDAIISLIILYNLEGNQTEADRYLNLARTITPDDSDLNDSSDTREIKNELSIKDNLSDADIDAEHLKIEGDCDESLMKYQQYLAGVMIPARNDYIKLGDLLNCTKDYSGAIAAYSKALQLGYDAATEIKRIKNYYCNNDSSRAVEELNKFESMASQESDFKFLLAEGFLATSQLEEAEKVYKDLMEEAETDSVRDRICRNLILLGEQYQRSGNYDKANSVFSDAAGLSENTGIAADMKIRQMQISDLLVRQGKYSEADNMMDQLYEKYKDEDSGNELFRRQIILGDRMIEANKFEETEKLYLKMHNRENDSNRLSELRQKRLYLGDAYAHEKEYGAADNVYNYLLDDTEDSVQIKIIKERISWLPKNGFSDGFASARNIFAVFIPRTLHILPFSDYYHDNRKFSQFDYGFQFEAGFINLLSLGGILKSTELVGSVNRLNIMQYMVAGKISLSKYLNLTGKFGMISGEGEPSRNAGEVGLHYDHPDDVRLFISYEKNDARLILRSPDIIKSGMNADRARLGIMNNYSNSFRLSVIYDYLRLVDGNKGNDLQVRFGKRFMTDGIFGYEYYFSDYSFNSTLYDTPQNLNSHGLWSEWNWTIDNIRLKISGKIGYIAARDFTFGDLAGEVIYKPSEIMTIRGKIGFGNGYRYNTNYTSFHGLINASFGIF